MITILKKEFSAHTLWLTMLVLTLGMYAISKLGLHGDIIMLLLLLTAATKGIIIIRDFMGLRGVSLLWRVIMYGWLLIVCSAIAIAYIISL
jgi:hypothetical protein